MRKHLLPLAVIAAMAIFVFYPFLGLNEINGSADVRLIHLPTVYILKNALSEGTLPYWTHALDAGSPIFPVPDKPFLYPPLVLAALVLSPYAALMLNVLLHYLLAGIGMYAFWYSFKQDKRAALIAAVVFMLNSGILNHLMGSPYWGMAMVYLPLMALFAMRALRTENWLGNSILVGVFASLQTHLGAPVISLYSLMMVALFLAYNLVGSGLKKRFVRSLLSGIVVIAVFYGLTAVKILPGNAYVEATNRNQPLPFEESLGHPLPLSGILSTYVKGKESPSTNAQVGILGALLAVLGVAAFAKTKNRWALFFMLLLLFTMIYASGVLYKPLWKYVDVFNKQRGVDRINFLAAFALAFLAGFGVHQYWNKVEKLKSATLQKLALGVLVVLLIADAFAYSTFTWPPAHESATAAVDNNNVMQYIATQKDAGLFRVHQWEIKGIDWQNVQGVLVPLGLEMMYGHVGAIWAPEYFHEYLGLGLQQPAKLWGMANVRYVTSGSELNVSGLRFVQKFAEYDKAVPEWADGPYLYENEQWLPRAYIVPHAVLAVGNYDDARRGQYAIIGQPSFNPNSTAVVMAAGPVENIPAAELQRFDAIVLFQGSLTQSSEAALKAYAAKGGRLLPNILDGKQELTGQDVDSLLSSLQGAYSPVAVSQYSQNGMTLRLSNSTGWLIVSEKLPLYKEWTALYNGEPAKMWRANGVFAAFPVQGRGILSLSYYPAGLTKGWLITGMTLLVLFVYAAVTWYKRTAKPGREMTEQVAWRNTG